MNPPTATTNRPIGERERDGAGSMSLPGLMQEVKDSSIAELHRRLAEQGFEEIRPAHGCVFRFVGREGIRPTDLAERAGLSKQSIGEFVADLEQLGYAERVPDPEDRRAKIIRLTRRGMNAQRAAREIFADIEREWAEQVGEERIAVLRDALERIQGLESAAPLPAQPPPSNAAE